MILQHSFVSMIDLTEHRLMPAQQSCADVSELRFGVDQSQTSKMLRLLGEGLQIKAKNSEAIGTECKNKN